MLYRIFIWTFAQQFLALPPKEARAFIRNIHDFAMTRKYSEDRYGQYCEGIFTPGITYHMILDCYVLDWDRLTLTFDVWERIVLQIIEGEASVCIEDVDPETVSAGANTARLVSHTKP